MPRIIAISDIHGMYGDLDLPDGDILVCAGDMTNVGRITEIAEFGIWLDNQHGRYKDIIVIAGNHDFGFQNDKQVSVSLLGNVHYLEDSGIEVQGIKFWGSPYTPMFYNWAFMDYDEELAKHWKLIPENTEFLITHGPPYSILDRNNKGQNCGSRSLYSRIKKLTDLRVHVYGHIHEGFGHEEIADVNFYNVAVLNSNYCLINKPTIIDLG